MTDNHFSDFSKVPKPSRTKNFGRSIHTGAQKEGADPVQHITKADKKAYKAEEKGQTNSRGSSLHDEEGVIVPRAPPRIVDSSDDEQAAPAQVDASTPTAPPALPEKAAVVGEEPVVDVPSTAAPLNGDHVPAEPTKHADSPAAPLKKRKSVKSSKTGTTTHRRKSSADAGLTPLSPVRDTKEQPAAAVQASAEPAAATVNQITPTSPTKSTASGKDGQLKKRASTKSNRSHKREKSGDASVLSEDHTLHLTGQTASTGLVKKPSTKSKTGRRKSLAEPTTTSAGAAVATL